MEAGCSLYYDATMPDQRKDVPTAPINKQAYQQMLNRAPSFSQSMINIATQLGTKPVAKPLTGTRQFTDKRGQVFQEMDKTKTKKVIAE